MSIKNRKRSLDALTKKAEERAALNKIAQEVASTSSSPEDYARNFLKKLLDQAEIHLIGEDDTIT